MARVDAPKQAGERRVLALPVKRLGVAGEDRPHGRAREVGRGIMSGRSAATPYVVFVGVMAFLAAVVLVVTLIWLLVMWIA